MSDPLAWWEKWRRLLGNAMVSRTSYGTLGELLALERLVQAYEQVEWLGPVGGSIDLVTPSAGYEVKSTVSRYDSRVHISGQFQLALSASKPLNLVHYRFEPSVIGESINTVCSRLSNAGFDGEKLESLLMRCGLEAGCSARTEAYNVLESRVFRIDDAFPKITPSSFLGGKLPQGVVHLEYQIDLTGLTCETF